MNSKSQHKSNKNIGLSRVNKNNFSNQEAQQHIFSLLQIIKIICWLSHLTLVVRFRRWDHGNQILKMDKVEANMIRYQNFSVYFLNAK